MCSARSPNWASRRQKQELLEALRDCYLRAGVLIDDPEVRGDPQWGKVQAGEAILIGVASGLPLSALTSKQRQALGSPAQFGGRSG